MEQRPWLVQKQFNAVTGSLTMGVNRYRYITPRRRGHKHNRPWNISGGRRLTREEVFDLFGTVLPFQKPLVIEWIFDLRNT